MRLATAIDEQCQVYSCMVPADSEIMLDAERALYVCARHDTAKVRAAFSHHGLSNATEYGYKDGLVVVSCVGEPPATHAPVSGPQFKSVFETSSWSPYWLPCIRCGKDFILDWTGVRGVPSIVCGTCKPRSTVEAPVAKKIIKGTRKHLHDVDELASRQSSNIEMEPVTEKLPRDFVEDPPSAEIAAALNAAGATYCRHHRDPCFTFCGVKHDGEQWVVISKERRKLWLDAIIK